MNKVIALIFLISCSVFGQSNDPGFILKANVGPSFRLAKIPDGLSADNEDYIKELKTGLGLDFSAYYVMHDRAYGLKYNVFRSKNERTNANTINFDPTVNIPTNFSDDITISYIGPSFMYTELQDAKLGEAFIEVSFGYMFYKNEASLDGQNFTIKGGNLGMIAGGGYHFRLHKQFLIGPQISFAGGTLRKLKYDFGNGFSESVSLNDEEFESLWRIDLSVSAKVRF